jgi:nucleotidyltransferase/DNA polymerase involved in DNA repair
LRQNSRDLAFIVETTDALCADVQDDLGRRDLTFKQVGVVAFLEDLTIRSRSTTLEQPTKSPELLRDTVKELLQKLLDGTDKDVRRVGVKISMFRKVENAQKRLDSFLIR